jgi:hypothetical protein
MKSTDSIVVLKTKLILLLHNRDVGLNFNRGFNIQIFRYHLRESGVINMFGSAPKFLILPVEIGLIDTTVKTHQMKNAFQEVLGNG